MSVSLATMGKFNDPSSNMVINICRYPPTKVLIGKTGLSVKIYNIDRIRARIKDHEAIKVSIPDTNIKANVNSNMLLRVKVLKT